MALFGNKKTVNDAAAKKATPKSEAPVSMKDLYSATPSKTVKGKTPLSKRVSNRVLADVLVRPLVTEKATNLGSENKYVFVVAKDANKITIAKAIEAVYGVKAVAVNIIRMSGKKVTRGRIHGQRKNWKKAVVTLKAGETIKVYEGV